MPTIAYYLSMAKGKIPANLYNMYNVLNNTFSYSIASCQGNNVQTLLENPVIIPIRTTIEIHIMVWNDSTK